MPPIRPEPPSRTSCASWAPRLTGYIRNGYTAPFDWRDLPEDYRIENGISYLEGYLPVNGTLCELDAEEMYMLDPFELYLKFTILPEIKKHTVTVVLREQETEITGSTEIIFP